jgi:putative PIN family toxin of toxin-antitoxin system
MNAFFDTNVLIAAFISRGRCAEVFEHCMGKHHVFISNFVLDELTEKLRKKFKYPQEEIDTAQRIILSGATIVAEATSLKISCRDKDDIHIIAAAITANADCIISGDDDLNVLKKVHGISIIKPGDFWKFEENFNAHGFAHTI